MKRNYFHGFSASCILLAFIFISCNKETPTTIIPGCDTCFSSINSLQMTDSNWVKQEDGSYKSDLTGFLKQAGIFVNQIYSVSLKTESESITIYPGNQVSFMDGSIQGNFSILLNNENYSIIFNYTNQKKYFGETPPDGLIPFHSVQIDILYRNQPL